MCSHRSSSLAPFFHPTGIGVIGVSNNPLRLGSIIYSGLMQSGFQGPVIPINPKQPVIKGVTALKSVLDLPDTVDLVMIAIPATKILPVFREIGKKGIKNVVIISGGFKELGGQGAQIESDLRVFIRQEGIRVIGPNCIGVFDARTRVESFFQDPHRMLRPQAGSVAFLTQSGTYGCSFLEQIAESPLGVTSFVSYGNRIDVDEADLIEYFAGDPETKVIAMYLEGLENGRRFFEAAKRVTKSTPIVILKSGRSPRGAQATKSHTGWLGGEDAVYRGVFQQAHLHQAASFRDLFDKTKALAMQPVARGANVGMIGNGMGPMVMAIDALSEQNIPLPPLSASSIEQLRVQLPHYPGLSHPIDITGSATMADYKIGLRILIEDPQIDIIMPFFVFQDTPLEESIVDLLGSLNTYGKPILGCAAGGPFSQKLSNQIETQGIPMYPFPIQAISAAHALYYQGLRMPLQS